MKKFYICLLTFCVMFAITGCKTDSSANIEPSVTSEYPVIDENIECASVVELTINPAFRFYLDEEQYVISVECLNDDAQLVCENLNLSKERFDEALSEVLVESVNQGFLTDEKTVNVEVVKNSPDVYAPDIVQNTADIINDTFAANNLKSDCSVVISDEIIEEQSDMWNKEDLAIYVDITENSNMDEEPAESDLNANNDKICDSCNGKGNITCDLCYGTGKVIEYEEHEVEVRNGYVCPYCGGAGILDDGLHGGQTAVCGYCGGGGATGPESGDFRELAYDKEIVTEEVEKVCSRCNGSGTMNCPSCEGTGIIN